VPPHSLPTSAAPNQRAGLKQAPVSGPPTMTRKTKVVPIASGAQSLRLFFEKTVERMTMTRTRTPTPSTTAPAVLPESRLLIEPAP
jgi:hypothetical protein